MGDFTITAFPSGGSTLPSDPALDRVLLWDETDNTVKWMQLANIATEAAPAAGDYVLVQRAEDDFVKVNWNLLPGGGAVTWPQSVSDGAVFTSADNADETLLAVAGVASAAGYITITNAEAGAPIQINATSSEDRQDYNLRPKVGAGDTGKVVITDATEVVGGEVAFVISDVDGEAYLNFADATEAVALRLGVGEDYTYMRSGGATLRFATEDEFDLFIATNDTNRWEVGSTTGALQQVGTTEFIQLNEITAPTNGAANTARIFSRDNGSGKTQLCCIFPTGAVTVIATEP